MNLIEMAPYDMTTDSAETIADRYTVLEKIGEGGMGAVYLARDTQLALSHFGQHLLRYVRKRMTDDADDREIKIAERFRVISTLGKGGVGAVYLAHDQVLDRRVAVRMLRVKEPTADTFVRFQKEAKAIAKLSHSAIMTALDFGVTESGEPYLVLDYLDGETLNSVLNKRECLSLNEAITVAIRVCEGLEYANAAGIIHRDIKPSNLYLADGMDLSESVKILDFGLARITLDDQKQTSSGTVIARMPLLRNVELSEIDLDAASDLLAFVDSKSLKRFKTTGMSKLDPKVYAQIRERCVRVVVDE
jgi:Serine/threonine protein kinase